MSSAELAAAINSEGHYAKRDGSPTTSWQVSARVSKYPKLFERLDDGRIGARRRLA